MREVEYKVWDKVLKRFLPVACLYYDGNSKFTGVFTGEETEGEWTVVGNEHLELVQFTGLKDKKGINIYEGDVYRMGYYSAMWRKNLETVQVVVWNENETSFGLRKKDCNNIEVIGNIYENPELLEEKK